MVDSSCCTSGTCIRTRQTLKKGYSRNTNRNKWSVLRTKDLRVILPDSLIISFRFDIQNVHQGTQQLSGERNCKQQYFWLDRTQEATLFICLLFNPKRKCFVDRLLSFCPFSFVLSFLLRFTDSITPFASSNSSLICSFVFIPVIREKRVKLYLSFLQSTTVIMQNVQIQFDYGVLSPINYWHRSPQLQDEYNYQLVEKNRIVFRLKHIRSDCEKR